MAITVFKRAAWKRNKDWPEGWEPWGSARKTFVTEVDSIEDARRLCKEHNSQRKSKGDVFYEFTEYGL